MRVACALLAGLTLVSCTGCPRQPQRMPVAAPPQPAPAKEPPFLVVDEPPPASAQRKLAVWDDGLWLMTGDGRHGWPLPIGGRIIARVVGETWVAQVVAWSPDRTRIAYLRQDSGLPSDEAYLQESSGRRSYHGPSGTVWIIGTEAGEPSRLTDLREVGRIVWSPDGRLLAASGTHRFMGPPAEASEGEGNKGNAEHDLVARIDVGLWLIDVEHDSAKLLHHAHTGNGDVGTYFRLCWSPDSRTIAATTPDASCEGDLGPSVTLADVATGKVHECGHDTRAFPKWLSQGGNKEAGSGDRDVIDLDTQEPPGA
ncbi:MAG: hypothetical protein FJX75_09000 [Armatimonadetes bacterium]|nr:hypothetical protein [Armatimonadota bacterium]